MSELEDRVAELERDREEVRAALRDLLIRYHPDRTATADATDVCQRLGELRERLRLPGRRTEA